MTKPTMEMVEEYGDRRESVGWCDAADREKLAQAAQEEADAILSEIRQRIEAMERREAELESDLAEAAKCAFQYAAKVGEMERDAARLDWLADLDNDRGQVLLPRKYIAAHMDSMRAAIDAAMAEGEG